MEYVLRMHPGNRLRELRKQAGLTQNQLADKAGVAQPTISAIENDHTPMTIEHMRLFAPHLGCIPADFLVDSDNPARLTAEEFAIIERFRAATPERREIFSNTAEVIMPFRAPPKADSAA